MDEDSPNAARKFDAFTSALEHRLRFFTKKFLTCTEQLEADTTAEYGCPWSHHSRLSWVDGKRGAELEVRTAPSSKTSGGQNRVEVRGESAGFGGVRAIPALGQLRVDLGSSANRYSPRLGARSQTRNDVGSGALEGRACTGIAEGDTIPFREVERFDEAVPFGGTVEDRIAAEEPAGQTATKTSGFPVRPRPDITRGGV